MLSFLEGPKNLLSYHHLFNYVQVIFVIVKYIFDQICHKRYFQSKQINWTPSLNSAYSNFDFLYQIYPKEYFWSQTEKVNNHHRILHTRISLDAKFQLKLTIWIFSVKFSQNGYFWWKQKKWTPPLSSVLFLRISLGTRFLFFLKILISWTKFSQKGYILWKKRKVNNAGEFWIFEVI